MLNTDHGLENSSTPSQSEDPFEDQEDRPSSLHASINTMPLPAPPSRLDLSRPRLQVVASGFPSRLSADFLNFTRPVSFSTAYSKVHPGTIGVAVLEQVERLDATEASLKKLGRGVGSEDDSEDINCEFDMGESPTPQVRGATNNQHSSLHQVEHPAHLPLIHTVTTTVYHQ